MRRYIWLIFLDLIFCIPALAQETQPIYFRDGHVITNPDSAEYYRVLNSQDGDAFMFTEYHKDGTRIEEIAEGSLIDPVCVGVATHYYKTGKVAIKQEYSSHGGLQKTTGYYPNGVLMYITYPHGPWPFESVAYDADSSGNVHIINGTGIREETDSLRAAGEHYIMKGPYKQGLKEGVWKGSDDKGLIFEQKYHAGLAGSGVATTNTGKKYHYTKLFELPRFKKNFDEFNRSILSNLKSQDDTLNLEFLKPGLLHLSYVINDQGEVTQLKGFRKNKRAMVQLELKRNQPKCRPAKLRGAPVPFVIANNRIDPTRKSIPFNTDLYLNGRIIYMNHKF